MNPTRTLHILLVEDDPTLNLFFVRALRRAGHTIETHTRGDDGLRAALACEYDVAVLDWRMPGLNGFDVIAGIRAAKPDQRVLLLSGAGDIGRKEAIAAGADAFLGKPCGLDELIRSVADCARVEPATCAA
jgi:two-component system, OmpR family, copper resistance phosphate regulon response regulator CusR